MKKQNVTEKFSAMNERLVSISDVKVKFNIMKMIKPYQMTLNAQNVKVVVLKIKLKR